MPADMVPCKKRRILREWSGLLRLAWIVPSLQEDVRVRGTESYLCHMESVLSMNNDPDIENRSNGPRHGSPGGLGISETSAVLAWQVCGIWGA